MFPYVQRIRDLVLHPRQTWPALVAEDVSASRLFVGWVLPLAAVPAVAYILEIELYLHLFATPVALFASSFAGLGLSFPAILADAVGLYALEIGAVALLAWIVQILAPQFGGQGDYTAGLKVVAYSFAPYWVVSILTIFALSALGVLAGVVVLAAAVYGFYLLYQGLGEAMRIPQEKRALMTVVVVVAALVLGILLDHVVPTV
jgi:hypothetical protein